jgi:hypothetical protein
VKSAETLDFLILLLLSEKYFLLQGVSQYLREHIEKKSAKFFFATEKNQLAWTDPVCFLTVTFS